MHSTVLVGCGKAPGRPARAVAVAQQALASAAAQQRSHLCVPGGAALAAAPRYHQRYQYQGRNASNPCHVECGVMPAGAAYNRVGA